MGLQLQRDKSSLWWRKIVASSKHSSRNKKLSDHIFNIKHPAERVNRTWCDTLNFQCLPLVTYFLQLGCTVRTSQKRTTN